MSSSRTGCASLGLILTVEGRGRCTGLDASSFDRLRMRRMAAPGDNDLYRL